MRMNDEIESKFDGLLYLWRPQPKFQWMLRICMSVREIVVAEIKLLILYKGRKQHVMSESSIRIYPNWQYLVSFFCCPCGSASNRKEVHESCPKYWPKELRLLFIHRIWAEICQVGAR